MFTFTVICWQVRHLGLTSWSIAANTFSEKWMVVLSCQPGVQERNERKNEIKNEWMDGLICIYLSAFPTDEHDIWLIYFLFMVLFAANSRYFRINIRGIFSYLLATKTKSFLWWCLDQKWKPGSFLIWEVLYSAFALSPFGGWGVNNKNGWQVLLE